MSINDNLHSNPNNNFENKIYLQDLPIEILEMIISNVPMIDNDEANQNFPSIRLVSKLMNQIINYSSNENIQKVFENVLFKQFKKKIEDIKNDIIFCSTKNCYHRALTIAYLEASKLSADVLFINKKVEKISKEIYSTELLDYSLWNDIEKQVVFTQASKLGHVEIIKAFIGLKNLDLQQKIMKQFDVLQDMVIRK